MKNYKVNLLKGFVEISTLSPNHKYYYRIKKPWEIAMGVFASSLAFFNVEDELIYCTPKKSYASYLPPYKCFKNVIWLNNGDYAFFIEYERNNSLLCILSLEDRICYTRRLLPLEDIDKITIHFKKTEDLYDILNSLKFTKKNINDDQNSLSFKENLFHKWYP